VLLPPLTRMNLLYYRFLYTLFMAADANFRLKSKNRNLDDVELSAGWSYYVDQKEYKHYWKRHVAEVEVRVSV